LRRQVRIKRSDRSCFSRASAIAVTQIQATLDRSSRGRRLCAVGAQVELDPHIERVFELPEQEILEA